MEENLGYSSNPCVYIITFTYNIFGGRSMAKNNSMNPADRPTAAALRSLRENEQGSAAEITSLLYDEATFAESAAYMCSGDGNFENVITGCGAVDGRLVFSFISETARDCGGFGSGSAKKICALLDRAVKNGAPVVGVFGSDGAYVGEGCRVTAAYREVMNAVREARKKLPLIAVVTGGCTGAAAVIARMFDVVITAGKDSAIYVIPPFLGGKCDECANGTVDIAAADSGEAFADVKKILSYMPSKAGVHFRVDSSDDPNRECDVTGLKADELIAALADNGSAVKLAENFGKNVISGFAMFNGIPAGFNAFCGKAGTAEFGKAARMAKICSRLGIAMVTFVDCEGYDSDEANGLAYAAAELSDAYSCGRNIRVNVICGHAYGSFISLIGGADYTIALEDAKISPLSPAAMAQLLELERIKEAKDPAAERAAAEAEYEAAASPVEAARCGEVDEIADGAELRVKLLAALEMLFFRY